MDTHGYIPIPTQVEIYCRIRENPTERQALLNQLPKVRRRDVRQLLDHPHFPDALDPLLAIPALRNGMRLSLMHKLISWRIDEEAVHYLRIIENQWLYIFDNNINLLKSLLPEDIAMIEGKCPKTIASDAEQLFHLIESKKIFRDLDHETCLQIKTRLISIDSVIYSLSTFCNDVNVLESYSSCLLHILEKTKQTITGVLWHAFKPGDQHKEYIKKKSPPGIELSEFAVARECLWAFVMQNYRELCLHRRPGGRLLARLPYKDSNKQLLYELGCLAIQLGFQLNKANVLKEAGPPTNSDGLQGTTEGSIFVHSTRNRSGFQKQQSHERVKKLLTLEYLYQKEHYDSLDWLVLRSKYHAFFSGCNSPLQVSSMPRAPLARSMLSMVSHVRRDIFEIQSDFAPESNQSWYSQWESEYDPPDGVRFKSRTGDEVAFVAAVNEDVARVEKMVQRKAEALRRQGYYFFSVPPRGSIPRTGAVLPQNCYRAAVKSGRHTILVMKQHEIKIDQALLDSLESL